LAASTRDGEEELILAAVTKANIPNLLTIIVPRHPQRFNEVADLLSRNSLNFMRRSSLASDTIVNPHISFVLGDSMGEMFTYYASCDVAFIGGSLLPLGGQNLIEACSMGKPVLIGPHTFNFEQATEMAIAAGAAERVHNGDDLALHLKDLLADSGKKQTMSAAALAFGGQNSGATERTLNLLAPYLSR
jgi:3-deoxy-D-manno-octulosonic-acid transferase